MRTPSQPGPHLPPLHNPMTRSELISRIALRFPKLLAKDAEISVRQLIDAITGSLAGGGRVEIRGFGSFAVTYRAPRRGRNPRTGEMVPIAGRFAAHFRPGKELRERVDTAPERETERLRKVA
jgi:integration host factor subunit beta